MSSLLGSVGLTKWQRDIGQVRKNNSLKTLNFDKISIGESGAHDLGAAIAGNTLLTSLELYQNDFGGGSGVRTEEFGSDAEMRSMLDQLTRDKDKQEEEDVSITHKSKYMLVNGAGVDDVA